MRLVLSFLLFVLAAPLSAQVSIHAYVDKAVLGDAETLAFTLEISGDLDELGAVQPPDARGLVLAQSTPVLRSQVITNGEEHLTIRWLYRPQRTGQAEILSARIPAGGRILETDPISINDRTAYIFGHLSGSVQGNHVVGNELESELFRVESLTIDELV